MADSFCRRFEMVPESLLLYDIVSCCNPQQKPFANLRELGSLQSLEPLLGLIYW